MKEKTITEILEEVKADVYDHICKYADQTDMDNQEAYEQLLAEKCNECPLNRL